VGGVGSGRYGRRSPAHLDIDYIRIGVRSLRTAGLLGDRGAINPADPQTRMEVELNGRGSEPLRVRLSRGTATGNDPWNWPRAKPHVPPEAWVSMDSLFVRLLFSVPTFGGWRMWFECPRSSCQRRCTVLYRPRDSNARAFACRLCHAIRYTSQHLSQGYRLDLRATRILERLWWKGRTPVKPKGMHERTFRRLLSEADKILERSVLSQPACFYWLLERLNVA
jgi:hypothetical protein